MKYNSRPVRYFEISGRHKLERMMLPVVPIRPTTDNKRSRLQVVAP